MFHDPEVPAGYQDADLEMRELEQLNPEPKEKNVSKTNPTPEGLIEGLGPHPEAVRAAKTGYARLRVDGRTLAYANDRKDGFELDLAGKALEKAPARLTKSLQARGSRLVLRVTTKNEKAAGSLLEWLVKNS